MLDPRFGHVLEFIDEVDGDGRPSTRAQLAVKIQAYGQDVADLKLSLIDVEEEVSELVATVAALEVAVEEQTSQKMILVARAQDAAVSAAMSSGGGGARLRGVAQEMRERVVEFEKDYVQDTARLKEAQLSLAAKQRAVRDQRGSIVRRLNTMSSLAERAGLEFGREMFEQPSQSQQPQQRVVRMSSARPARRRPRRVVRRRRRAS
jgi:hypothetical protein